MTKKIQPHQKKFQRRLVFFYKRWKIDLGEKERWLNFKERNLNAFVNSLGDFFEQANSKIENEFLEIVGNHRLMGPFEDIRINGLKDSPVYQYLQNADQINFLLGLQTIFWMENIHAQAKEDFFMQINDVIAITGVPLFIKQTTSEYIFYPQGARLLDEKLVDDNLDWLSSYPKSDGAFKKALSKIGKSEEERDIVDNLRLSLELLFKDILKNKKTLENQKEEIGKYFQQKHTSKEISNLFWAVLDYYSKYQNNKAKHDNNVPSNEVEFMLYLTGTLMRFLLTR